MAQRSGNTAALISAARGNGFFPQSLARATAIAPADIPVLAWGVANAVSAINARAATNPLVPLTDSRIKFIGGATVYGGYSGWNPRGAYYGPLNARQSAYGAIEFTFTGTDMDIPVNAGGFYNSATHLRILVNDRIVASSALPIYNNGSWYFLRVTFAAAANRRIRIEGAGGGRWRGVNCVNSADISSTARNYPLVTVMGDSFIEGTGSNGYDPEAVTMVRALGCDIYPGGVGSTGLISPGTAGKVNWMDAVRMTDLTLSGVIADNGVGATVPNLGIVMLSVNDTAQLPGIYGATLQEAITNNCLKLIDAWIAANPGKPLVLFGPTWPNGSPVLDIYRIRDGGQEAVWQMQRSNVWFIDRLGPGPTLRSGIFSTLTDQASLYTGTDTTHPTAAGHILDGLWMARQLRELIISEMG
jgi:lysophospholipase L1-like esterase